MADLDVGVGPPAGADRVTVLVRPINAPALSTRHPWRTDGLLQHPKQRSRQADKCSCVIGTPAIPGGRTGSYILPVERVTEIP